MTKTVVLPVKGMDCASCANIVNHVIKKTPGVIASQVNLATEKATIEFNSSKVSLETINAGVKKAGYSLILTPTSEDHSQHTDNLTILQKQVKFLFPLSLFVFIFMLYDIAGRFFGLPLLPVTMNTFNTVALALSSVVLFGFGTEFLSAIPRFFKTRVANMNTLIGIGSTVAYIYSTLIFLIPSIAVNLNLPETTYFDVVIIVIGFIKFGKYLEQNSKQKTGEAIKKLLELGAKTALVERAGQEVEINISEVKLGDTVIVKPGAKIPVDGKIIEGFTTIDESAITGEAIPVDRTIGELVVSGTINKQGYIKFKAEKVGSDTLLAQIISMVESAQGSKAPIEKMADKISAIFVPTVLILSVASFLVWLAFGNLSLAISSFVGILVIACPCALGLATPTAIIVGVGKGAQNGILVKDASVLEKLYSIDTIVFDKTGTITKGHPQVTSIINTSDQSVSASLSVLASLENKSGHPLAKAITDYAKENKATIHTIQHFKEIPGKGVSGQFKTKHYLAGNLTLLKEHKVEFDADQIKEYTTQGMTPIFLFTDRKLQSITLISDTLKEESIDAIKNLHRLGIKTIMLTGDDANTASFIGKQAGIDHIYSQVLPTEKAKIIKTLTKEGAKVAMVGDGINDAPALAEAEVGIAMSTGTDIAIESAGITLLHGDLSKVTQAIKLSKATMNTIRQNLFWAFFYNIIGIPIAAGVLYPLFGIVLNPAIAGAAMAFSSVSVVTNSLRLKSAKI
jgi:P-type Cu+ transporter